MTRIRPQLRPNLRRRLYRLFLGRQLRRALSKHDRACTELFRVIQDFLQTGRHAPHAVSSSK